MNRPESNGSHPVNLEHQSSGLVPYLTNLGISSALMTPIKALKMTLSSMLQKIRYFCNRTGIIRVFVRQNSEQFSELVS